MTQTYNQSLALGRMRDGLCPECGNAVDKHTGWGGPGCTLTDNGVAERIAAFRQSEPVRYVVQGPGGFTESFDERAVQTLVNLGVIEHERDGYVLEMSIGGEIHPEGALHRFYGRKP